MARRKYLCIRCNGNHYYDSRIGREHFTTSSSTKRTAVVQTPMPFQGRNLAPAAVVNSRARTRDSFTDAAASVTVGLLFQQDGPYAVVADEVLANVPFFKRRKIRQHWLCAVGVVAADALSEVSITNLAARTVEERCSAAGMPTFFSKIVGKSSGVGLSLVTADGTEGLVITVKALTLLNCPEFDKCPGNARILPILYGTDGSVLRESLLAS